MAKGTRNKGGGSAVAANKEVNKENHKNVSENRHQNSTDHPTKGGRQNRNNRQKIVVSAPCDRFYKY